jgi:hypothetical protein
VIRARDERVAAAANNESSNRFAGTPQAITAVPLTHVARQRAILAFNGFQVAIDRWSWITCAVLFWMSALDTTIPHADWKGVGLKSLIARGIELATQGQEHHWHERQGADAHTQPRLTGGRVIEKQSSIHRSPMTLMRVSGLFHQNRERSPMQNIATFAVGSQNSHAPNHSRATPIQRGGLPSTGEAQICELVQSAVRLH